MAYQIQDKKMGERLPNGVAKPTIRPPVKAVPVCRPTANPTQIVARPGAKAPTTPRPPRVALRPVNPALAARQRLKPLPADQKPRNQALVTKPGAVLREPGARPVAVLQRAQAPGAAHSPPKQAPNHPGAQQQCSSPKMGSRYRMITKLGTGTFGIVFKVEDNKTGENRALKLIRNTVDEVGLLRREVSILMNLAHSNIVRIHSAEFLRSYSNSTFTIGESWDVSLPACVIVMELCDYDLKSKLSRRSGISDPWNRNIFRQLVLGVAYLHSNNIIHRDLKPANILLKGDIVKISDFGVAKCGVFTDPINQTIVGTPAYMAPEAITGRYDNTVDVYSLGIILIELYTPNQTFMPLLHQVLGGKKNISSLLCQVPHNIKSLASVMILEPGKRPSCDKLLKSNTAIAFENVSL